MFASNRNTLNHEIASRGPTINTKPAQFSFWDLLFWVGLSAFGMGCFPFQGAALVNQIIALMMVLAVWKTRPILRHLLLALISVLFVVGVFGPKLLKKGANTRVGIMGLCGFLYIAAMLLEVRRMVLVKT